MHEMKWTELHIHGLFCSFDCVASAFYRSSLGWTKMDFFFWSGCWEQAMLSKGIAMGDIEMIEMN